MLPKCDFCNILQLNSVSELILVVCRDIPLNSTTWGFCTEFSFHHKPQFNAQTVSVFLFEPQTIKHSAMSPIFINSSCKSPHKSVNGLRSGDLTGYFKISTLLTRNKCFALLLAMTSALSIKILIFIQQEIQNFVKKMTF